LRLFPNYFMYDNFNEFERNHTLALYNKKSPAKAIAYLMFLPGEVLGNSSMPKIVGWAVMYNFNNFYFRDVYGTEGSGAYRLITY
jgi:hypothetical protein